jgi:23S rRNA pseudouridine955/2504/2580 synthase
LRDTAEKPAPGDDTVRIGPEDADARLDRWLRRRYPEAPYALVQKWLRTGQVRLNGSRVRAGARLQRGDRVRLPPVTAATTAIRPKPAPQVSASDAKSLRALVLHRDDQVLAINKPPGLAVQGGTGTRRHLDAMLDALRYGALDRPRLVHRLDKDTSGILVLARNARAAASLAAAFRAREARKIYWAIVAGVPSSAVGRIDLDLAKRPGQKGERTRVVEAGGRRASTFYRVIDWAGNKAAWVVFEPLTGRTHQIRAHAVALGTPVLGDGKYGGRRAFIEADGIARNLHLHARAIRIPHPAGGTLEVVAPLPEHMREAMRALGFDARGADDAFAGSREGPRRTLGPGA